VHYQRQSPVPFAPPELKKVHPLGKSPVLQDGNRVIAESGAEVEYLIDTHGNGKLKPKHGTDDYWKYVEWMHYAEGSAMLPLLMALYTGMLGEAAAPLKPRVDGEIANNLSYMQSGLGDKKFFVGNELTGADIQLLFVLEAPAHALNPIQTWRSTRAAMQDRPAYNAASKRRPLRVDEPIACRSTMCRWRLPIWRAARRSTRKCWRRSG